MMTAGSRNSGAGSASGAASGSGGGASSDCANNFFSFDEFPNQSRISSPLQNPPMTIPTASANDADEHQGGQQEHQGPHGEPHGPNPAPFQMSSMARAKMERAAQYHAFHARQQLHQHQQQHQQRRTPLDDVFADIPPSPLSSLLLGGAIGSFQHHPHHAQHAAYAAAAAASGRPYPHVPLSHPNDPASSTPPAPAPTTSSLGFTNYPAPPSSSSSSTPSSSNPLVFSTSHQPHHKPSPSSSTSIPLSPYNSSLLLPLDMYATTPEGQRHHIHLMDSPAMSSLLLHPHIAPSAGTLTPTPLATLPGGVCADPKLLCAPGASSSSSSSGQLPPAASAFAYQQGPGYYHHQHHAYYGTHGMSAAPSVASALSMAALDPASMSGASSRFTSPAGAFRALSAPPMVESRIGSPVRELGEDEDQVHEGEAMDQDDDLDEHMHEPVAGPTTRRMTRRARRYRHGDAQDMMEVDHAHEFDMVRVAVKLEPNADVQDQDQDDMRHDPEPEPAASRAKRPVGRPRKSARGRPRRVEPEPEAEPEPEPEAAVVAEVPVTRGKRATRRGAAKASSAAAKDGGLISGLGDALLLTAAAAAKSVSAAADGSVHQGSDAEDHGQEDESPMQPPPPPAPAAPKSKASRKRSRTASAPNPPTAGAAAASISAHHPYHPTYPRTSQVVGQVDLFPHPLDARVTDLRRHFKSRNSFGSGALELALSAPAAAPPSTSSAPAIPSPLSASASAGAPAAGGDDDEQEDDGKPKTTEEAKALGLSKDAIRQLRNKISARNFRQRKKQYIHTLEDQVLDLKRQLAEEVKARVEVESKLNQCERQLGLQETPARGEWPVGWREEVGRIGMMEGDFEDDGDDGEDDEGDGEEGAGASKKKRQRVSSAAGKKASVTAAADGSGEAAGKRKSASRKKNASASTAEPEPEPELEPTLTSRQSSMQPNQAPMTAANYYSHAGTAPPAMVAMPPGIYSPLQQQHLSTASAAAVASGVYPPPTVAGPGYPAAHPFMAYHQHMHSASAQAAISHARRAAAAAVTAAMGGGAGQQHANAHGMYQHGQGPHHQIGVARR